MSLIPRSIRLAAQDSLKHQTNLIGEVMYTNDNSTLVVFDGKTIGGHPLLKADLSNASVQYKSVFTGTTPPKDVEYGTIWFNSHNGNLYVYTQTATTGIWVQPSSPSFGSLNRDIGPDANTLEGNTLASNVTASSLTSVGTLTGLTVASVIHGDITGNAGSVTHGVYTTGHYSDPSWIASLAGNKIIGPVGSVTNGIYTTDTGTVTNNMLAGNIDTSKLVSNYFTINGTQVPLGGSITTSTLVGQSLSMTSAPTFNGLYVTGAIHATNLVLSGALTGTLPIATTSSLGVIQVDGTTININNGVISTPTATTSTLGLVKVDGSTITINNGVISGTNQYVLPTATTSTLGGVKVDGSTITINNGVISGASTPPTATGIGLPTVIDTSNSPTTITAHGNVTASTNLPTGGSGYSLKYPTGDRLDYCAVSANSKLLYTGNTWTVEAWFMIPVDTTQTTNATIWSSTLLYLATNWGAPMSWTFVDATTGGAGNLSVWSTNIIDGNWHHIAVVRNGSSVSLYGDGVRWATGTSTTSSTNFGSTGDARIGGGYNSVTDHGFIGYIYNLRISKVARYSGVVTFTPDPAYIADANTLLMTSVTNANVGSLGVVRPDNSSITVSNGVLSAVPMTFGSSISIGTNTAAGIHSVAIGNNAGHGSGQNSVAIGDLAGTSYQGDNAVAIGESAGASMQGSGAIHIGNNAGYSSGNGIGIGTMSGNQNQQYDTIAIGTYAGYMMQAMSAIAIGNSAGGSTQNPFATALGWQAGYQSQGTLSIAIGTMSGSWGQGQQAIAIGSPNYSYGIFTGGAGASSQGDRAIAVGASDSNYVWSTNNQGPGGTSQGHDAIAIGTSAGSNSQGVYAIGIGYMAGAMTQQQRAIAIGENAGYLVQGISAIAIGTSAGSTNQSSSAVAIGMNAGNTSQSQGAIAIGGPSGMMGVGPGHSSQGYNAVAIGTGDTFGAGAMSQGSYAVAIGSDAGGSSQGTCSTAIGINAGSNSQSNYAIAIGNNAGSNTQGESAIAIGPGSGYSGQGAGAIAIGWSAGGWNQGAKSIAIGWNAGDIGGSTYQAANSIVIDASGSGITPTQAGLYINPVRKELSSTRRAIFFNTTTSEVTYAQAYSPTWATIASATTITPVGDDGGSQYNVTALAAAATIAIPSGSPVNGQPLTIRIKDNGTGRALTWTTSAGGYRVIGVTLPTTTVANKVHYIRCVYNQDDGYWDVLNVNQQA